MTHRFLRRLAALFSWSSRDHDMDQEMSFHVESLAREYTQSGMTEEEATRSARQRFGSVLHLKERGHDARSSRVLEDLLRDLRHAGRGLRRAPGFATAVILTLALGIGGNTTVFSVVDQLLLRPLPYPDGDRLVTVYEHFTLATGLGRGERGNVSPANWLDWQRESRTLSTAAWDTATATLTGVGEPVRLNSQVVSWEFFPLLGVHPLLGRTVSKDDDRPKAAPVAVLSYGLWQRRFGGDRRVIGRVIQLNDVSTEVIGVMPDSFRFVYPDNDVWGAFRLDRDYPWRQNSGRFMNVAARLQPGATMATARAEMESIARRLEGLHAFNKGAKVTLVPMREELTGQVETSLLVLYGAVAVLLSIACLNVANLLLARAAARRREIAIRTSLGAGRLAIVRQLLVESLLLAVLGGALGIALARWGLDALVAVAPADLLRVPDLYVDRRVMLYALGLSVLTGVIVGLVPALSVARRSLAARMRTSGTNVTQSPRVRQALVICQVAMTVVLLSAASLLVRTVIALDGMQAGLDRSNLLTMELTLPAVRYTPERRTAFYRQALETLRGLPGVEAAAAANSLPVIGTPRGGTYFHRFGTPDSPTEQLPMTSIRVVMPTYFRTLGIPVRKGREFTDADLADSSGFIVNEAFVKAYLQGDDPLSVSLSVLMNEKNPHLPIVGVVGDVSEGSVRDSAQPTVFYNHALMQQARMTLFVRTPQPVALAPRVVQELRALDANLPVTDVRTFEAAIAESVARERLNAIVSGAFALSGLVLASLGLYGLLAFLVTERTKEIGIRIALGAKLGQLTRSVVGAGFRLVAIGAAIGLAASLALSRSIGGLLFGVTPSDLTTYGAVLGLLIPVAALASYLPARRAARIQPLIALRQE